MSNDEVTHILIADDDPHIRELARLYFESAGFQVDDVEDGVQALERVALGGLDLLVLDVMLPGLDGWAVLKKIREQDGWLPVIMLTAAGAEDHRILGLELGADDYLTKPFSPRELVARVKAVLRRVPPVPVGDEAAVIHLPGLVLDASAHTAFCGHEQLTLTPREFELLWFLAKHPRHVFSRAQLLDKVWGFDFEGDDRTVDVHITRLRKKLEATGTTYQYLETVWGHGYRLQPEPRA